MRRGRSRPPVRDGIAVALVVIALGILATMPRAQPVPVPASPCAAAAPEGRLPCLAVAHALMAR